MGQVKIDGTKLQAAIKTAGLNQTAASQMIDRNPNYVSNCISRGKIDEAMAYVLEVRAGIPLSLYEAPEKPAAPVPVTEPVQLTIDQPAAVFYEILDELKALRQELNVLIDYQDDRAKDHPDDWPVF